MLGVVIVLSLVFTCTVPVYATENDSGIAPASMVTATETVTDKDGNRFSLRGYSLRMGNYGQSTTSFETTFYQAGTVTAKNELDAKVKTLGANGNALMNNGAATSYSDTVFRSGASDTLTIRSDALIYYLASVSTTHTFSFNGISWSRASYDNDR